MRVIRYGKSFHAGSSFKTWIYRITINQCKNIRDSIRKTTPNGLESQTDEPDHLPSPDTERSSELREAVAKLGQPRANVVLLCYHAGMTHEQAAEILQIPLGTLKSRLHAALGELRETLTPEYAS